MPAFALFGRTAIAHSPAATISILLALLLLPIALVALARRRALREQAADPARTWFDFMRLVQGAATLSWISWLAGADQLGAGQRLAELLRPISSLVAFVAPSALFLIPPGLATVAILALAHGVTVRFKGSQGTLRECVIQALAQQSALVVPVLLLVLAGAAAWTQNWRWTPALGIGAVIARLALLRLQFDASGMSLNAITAGELRDRVFDLARRSGVHLRQLYVLPMARARLANAFAMRDGLVLLTDLLLERLSRREVDAVLAHEVAHLRARHPQLLGLALAIPLSFAIVLLPQFGVPFAMPLGVIVGLLAMMFLARRFEYAADAGAVKLCGDPEAMITGLVRLHRLNLVPTDWSGWSAALLTHPSTRRRAEAIGRLGGIPAARIEQLMRLEVEEGERYAMPEGARAKIFSTRFKMFTTTRLGWVLLAICCFTPAVAFRVASAAGVAPGGRAGLDALALVATFALILATVNHLAVRPYRALERELRRRLADEGLAAAGAEGWFVGLAPDAAPRVYESFGDWDVGLLFPDGDRLHYFGEEARFSLSRDQVSSVAPGDGLPGWLSVPRVLVTWRTPAAGGTLSLRPSSASTLRSSVPETLRLLRALQAWKGGVATAERATAALPVAPPPAIGVVTSQTPREHVHPRTLMTSAVFTALLAWGSVALLGLPVSPADGGLLDVFWVAMLVQVALRVPVWRHRERAATPAPAQLDRAA